MRALVYTAPGKMGMEDRPRPLLAEGEVEIAVSAAGICTADVAGFVGRSRHRTAPVILGHELVGRTGDGRRVVADPVVSCGRCAECQGGMPNLCSSLRLMGMDGMAGCFAESVAVSASHLHEIPESLEDARAVFAEPLANIVHLFRLIAPPPFFCMGIVGAGTMGSLALKMALLLGVREVLVEDVDEARLAAAREMGATLAVHCAAGQGEARGIAAGGLDVVLDACGEGDARRRAFNLCRPGGTVVLLGMAQGRSELDFSASIRKEHRVLMSFGYTPADFRRSVDLLAAGEMDLSRWTEERPLEDGQRAFEKMSGSRGETLKMVLRVR